MNAALCPRADVWLLFVLSLGVAGCGAPGGPERAPVTGKVTFDGAPVETGTIELIPAEGVVGPSSGAAIANGQYKIAREKGPLPGTHKVVIRATRKTGRKVQEHSPAGGTYMEDEMEAYIPAKYNRDTELSIDIQPGKIEQDFDLRSR